MRYRPNSEEVRKYREENECGLAEANRALRTRHVERCINLLDSKSDMYDVKEILSDLFDLVK